MAFERNVWERRLKYRSDLTSQLTHLTKPVLNENNEITLSAVEVLIKILKEKKLIGSTSETGFIRGSNRAVCFQDAPLYGVIQNILHEETYRKELGGKLRYEAIGLSLFKPYLFNQSKARPVIYLQREESEDFNQNELWRIVTYDLSKETNIIDWTHEREWRIKGDCEFPLSIVTVLLADKKQYREFIKKVPKSILEQIKGIVVLSQIVN